MGMITDFFAATPVQLADAFAGWYTISPKKAQGTVMNPFTGEKQQITDWQPDKFVKKGKDNAFTNIRVLPHAALARIDHVKLATLNGLIVEADFDESVATIATPALLPAHGNGECGLHELPSTFVDALAELDPKQLKTLAKRWQKTDEMKADRFKVSECEQVLTDLCRVATAATEQNAKMFFLWSL